jgi:hypothetical protein
MKGFKKSRLAPSNHTNRGRGLTFCGHIIKPKLDLQAKWHQKFDDMMSDKAHREKMSKVKLPTIEMREPNWGNE